MNKQTYNQLAADIQRHGYDVGFMAYVRAMESHADTFAKIYHTGPDTLIQTAYKLASDLSGLGYYH